MPAPSPDPPHPGAPRARRLRLAAALILALGVMALGWWLAGAGQRVDGAASGTFAVEVVGPDGTVWAGNVSAGAATALSVLEEAARLGGFGLDVQRSAGFGDDCQGVYVRGIAGIGESGGGGWNFYVAHDGQPAMWIPHSAACCALRPGDAVSWRWVASDRYEAPGSC